MFKRQRTGSVICASCGSLVGVNDERCYSCGRRNPGLWGFGPMLRQFGNDLGFISLVLGGCTGLYGVMLLMTVIMGGNVMGGGNILSILSPDPVVSFMFGASGAQPVFRFRRWWTPLSATWLHGGVLHILFNMMALRQLGPATADIYGAGRMVIVYTVAGVTGFLMSSIAGLLLGGLPIPFLRGADFTLGASASIFGLVGALVYYGRRGGSSMIHREAMGYVTSLFIMGLLLPGIDNYAHAGGFLGGYAAAIWLDPLKPERMDHFALAAACIVLSALAIIGSILTAIPLVFR
jgi:rhomboid protease GluP